ncbi:hypothetical protein BDZ94DRAFT_193492 [Collybia nuda]|uniref:Uncharacterized protein n=1 Tax=Collybia nuda TaxID=64659 RepID=A0A9P5XVW6_9AGAR|nr:hypothetical protein BDZ94DRAFT_193492 [Collybia nuda]
MSISSNSLNTSIPVEHVPHHTTSTFISHCAHIPNLAFDHARTVQQLFEDIFRRHQCYGTYTIHAEFDEDMARTGQGLLQVIVINSNAIWCSRKMEHEIGLAAWPFVTKLHLKPLPLPCRTIKIAPVAPRSSSPSTGATLDPSPTLTPFLGRNGDTHLSHTHLQNDGDNRVDILTEPGHINDANPINNGEKWQIPVHSGVEGDYAMSLDSRINVEVVPAVGKQFIHIDPGAEAKNCALEFPSVTLSITPIQLAIPRVIDEKTTRLVPPSKLPTLITSNVRARVSRVLNLNLPQDRHSTLQAFSYVVRDTKSTQGTISFVEKTLRPVSVNLNQGHVDIHGRSCSAELDWCYNLGKSHHMHSITMEDPAHATFVLCGPRPDDLPLLDFDFVVVWRLQNEISRTSKFFASFPCAQAKEPINAYSHIAHRVSAQIDLDDMMHNHPAVCERDKNRESVTGTDMSHSAPTSRLGATKTENGRFSSLQFLFMHALRGKIQKKKLTVKNKKAPDQSTTAV